jgi:hypothetical protein
VELSIREEIREIFEIENGWKSDAASETSIRRCTLGVRRNSQFNGCAVLSIHFHSAILSSIYLPCKGKYWWSCKQFQGDEFATPFVC